MRTRLLVGTVAFVLGFASTLIADSQDHKDLWKYEKERGNQQREHFKDQRGQERDYQKHLRKQEKQYRKHQHKQERAYLKWQREQNRAYQKHMRKLGNKHYHQGHPQPIYSHTPHSYPTLRPAPPLHTTGRVHGRVGGYIELDF